MHALTEASARSQSLIAQFNTLTAKEAQLETQLAHVRAQKAAIEQEQANLSQQIPNFLAQAKSGPLAFKQAQTKLRQNKKSLLFKLGADFQCISKGIEPNVKHFIICPSVFFYTSLMKILITFYLALLFLSPIFVFMYMNSCIPTWLDNTSLNTCH